MLCLAGMAGADPWTSWHGTAYANQNVNIPTGFSFTAAGTIQAKHLLSTDDAQIHDYLNLARLKANTSIYSAGTLNSGGTATLNAAKVNGTTYSVGALTTNALFTGANAKINGTTYSVGAMTGNGQITGANIKSNATIYAVTALTSGGLGTFANAKINGTTYSAGALTGNGQITGANIKSNATIYAATTLNSGGFATLDGVKSNSSIYAATTLNSAGTATLNAAKVNGTTYSVGAVSSDALITGANVKSNATMYAATTLNSGGAATLNSLVVNTTAKVNGATHSVGAVSSDALITGANVKSKATMYAVTTLNSGGTATLNAVVSNTTVSAAADGIRANNTILPGEMVVNWPITKAAITSGDINSTMFIADDAWNITSIEEVHSAAETTATTMNINVMKTTGTNTLAQGINVTTATINLKGGANTVQTMTLNSSYLSLADGDRLGILCNMTGVNDAGEFRGGVITIHMKRVGNHS